MPITSLLDPVVVAQLGNLELRARRVLDGLYAGFHTNPHAGSSQIFSQHRPYTPGDDLRRLDWKVFARTDKFLVRQFEEESNVGAQVYVDDSASMGFSHGGRPSKLEYAKVMAATIGYILVAQHDGVGLVSRDQKIEAHNNRAHLEQYCEKLEKIQPQGVWDLSHLLNSSYESLARRSFVVVFTDLFQNGDEVLSQLRTLHSQRHEVIVFHLLDPAEIDLPFDGAIRFKDSETGEELTTEPNVIREAYKEEVHKKLENIAKSARGGGLEYVLLTTDTSFAKGVGAYLSFRSATR